jgi:hypothetical protein
MTDTVRETRVNDPAYPGATSTTVVRERSNTGRNILIIVLVLIAAVAIAYAAGLINLDTSGKLKAPSVNVSGGEVPKVQLETAKIDVGTKNETIKVPTVDVTKAGDDGSANK